MGAVTPWLLQPPSCPMSCPAAVGSLQGCGHHQHPSGAQAEGTDPKLVLPSRCWWQAHPSLGRAGSQGRMKPCERNAGAGLTSWAGWLGDQMWLLFQIHPEVLRVAENRRNEPAVPVQSPTVVHLQHGGCHLLL